VARVVAFVPDLLFGSNVAGALRAAGHDPVLVGDVDALRRELAHADALIVDLTSDAADRIEQVRLHRTTDLPTLAFYSHVETEVRRRAQQAGFDLVVPRSRMAREGAALVQRLAR
jgi:CheY-like chemotaxis protein